MRTFAAVAAVVVAVAGLAFAVISAGTGHDLTVYCSADEDYARPVVERFEQDTGLTVRLVTDLESNKGVGLVQRLRAERGRPVADVYWNNELSRTLRLAQDGLLQPHRSAAAAGLPEDWVDPDGLWTAFSCRARVIVVHADKVPAGEEPRTVADLADPRWRDQAVMARPTAGTTQAHMAALRVRLGADGYDELLRAWDANGVRLVPSNSAVRDAVGRGEALVGLTDTDDVWGGLDAGLPLRMVVPEPTYVIPNSVALLAGAPHPDAGRRFIDWLLRPETEEMLAHSRARQMPGRADVPVPDGVRRRTEIRDIQVDPDAIAEHLDEASARALEILEPGD